MPEKSDGSGFIIDSRLIAKLDETASPTGHARPSPRQLQILRLLSEGLSHRTIGAQLGIAQATVDKHLANFYVKFKVSTQRDALDLARASGWIS